MNLLDKIKLQRIQSIERQYVAFIEAISPMLENGSTQLATFAMQNFRQGLGWCKDIIIQMTEKEFPVDKCCDDEETEVKDDSAEIL